MTERLLRRREVQERVCLSTSHIYSQMAIGRFPRPVRIGAKAVAWRAAEIDEWIASRPLAGPEPKAR